MNSDCVERAKKLFLKIISDHNSDPFGLVRHLDEVERWVAFLIKNNPKADEEICHIGVWLHDAGYYPLKNEDHAITSERITKAFLEKEGWGKNRIENAMHVVRAHRCRDVKPESIEAKILGCADSASHLTDIMYIDIVKNGKYEYVVQKLERDYRDTEWFPEVKEMLTPIYRNWKMLLPELIEIERARGIEK